MIDNGLKIREVMGRVINGSGILRQFVVDVKARLLSYKRTCKGSCRAQREDSSEDTQKAYTIESVGCNKKRHPPRQFCYRPVKWEFKWIQDEGIREARVTISPINFAIAFPLVERSFSRRSLFFFFSRHLLHSLANSRQEPISVSLRK